MSPNNPKSIGAVKAERFTFAADQPFITESGGRLSPITVEYEVYGKLNANKSNAILICHALSGSAHAAGYYADRPDKVGWWDDMIGPGKAFDTERYCVVCSNILGSCHGTTGPASIDPQTGKPFGIRFPIVTVGDMVAVQKQLMDYLGIQRWFSVAGGSLGGMQALEWAYSFPEHVLSVMPIATSAALSPQGIAFNEVGRKAIMSDPAWNEGDYYQTQNKPDQGLAIARMIGHITYLSDDSMQAKFGRRGVKLGDVHFGKGHQFEVESYLHYKGSQFTRRFDANTYLYVTKAMDLFDLKAEAGSLKEAFRYTRARWLVVSFSSDWLFPPAQSREIVQGLRATLADVTYYEVQSQYGHDAFLLETSELTEIIRKFLNRVEVKGESHFGAVAS